MNASAWSLRAISTSPFVAAATYVGLLILLLFVAVSSFSDLIDQRSELAASSAMLAQLEGRTPRAGGAPGELISPLQGTVLKVEVEKGAQVEEGALIAVIEAMKMENEITAPVAGTVEELHVSPGGSVSSGDTIAVIK